MQRVFTQNNIFMHVKHPLENIKTLQETEFVVIVIMVMIPL